MLSWRALKAASFFLVSFEIQRERIQKETANKNISPDVPSENTFQKLGPSSVNHALVGSESRDFDRICDSGARDLPENSFKNNWELALSFDNMRGILAVISEGRSSPFFDIFLHQAHSWSLEEAAY